MHQKLHLRIGAYISVQAGFHTDSGALISFNFVSPVNEIATKIKPYDMVK